MPNWIEGTLKVRGTAEKIIAFLENGLTLYDYKFITDESVPKPIETWANTSKNDIEYKFYTTTEKVGAYIEGSRRAFVQRASILIWVNTEAVQTVCLDIKQAWDFSDDGNDTFTQWEQISEKYGVDLRLYGVERGAQFVDEVIIRNGKTTLHNTTKYEDWDWDCPFPEMGG